MADIEKGKVTVGVVEVAQVPRSHDAPGADGANGAYARLQNLVPAPEGTDAFFVNDTRGFIYRVDPGAHAVALYLDIHKHVTDFDDLLFPNEAGLAGFAFHPDFLVVGTPGYGKFYVTYSARRGTGKCDYLQNDNDSHECVIREFTTRDPKAPVFDPAAEPTREVFRVGKFGKNHNVGTAAFNPNVKPGDADWGMLYVSFGDGASSNDPHRYGQTINEPLGSLIRINPLKTPEGKKYSAPADNPFIGTPDAAPEVWCYGLRHPQFFSWDRGGMHRMYIADMGQDQIDEVNVGIPGANYGWQLREGTYSTGTPIDAPNRWVYPRPSKDPTPLVYPVAQYDHDDGKAISSVVVYRGTAIPELSGKLLCADIVNGRIFYCDEDKLKVGRQEKLKELQLTFDGRKAPLRKITSHSGGRVDLRLGTDNSGEIYLLTKSDGKIRKLVLAK